MRLELPTPILFRSDLHTLHCLAAHNQHSKMRFSDWVNDNDSVQNWCTERNLDWTNIPKPEPEGASGQVESLV